MQFTCVFMPPTHIHSILTSAEGETLLVNSLFLRGINLFLKDLSSGNCEIGEGLYLNQIGYLEVIL